MGEKNGIDNLNNNNSNMFMSSLGSLSTGLASFENGEDSLNMNIPGHLGVNNFFNELGFAENLDKLHLDDRRRSFENGFFIRSPVYHKLPNNGISGVNHTVGPFLDIYPFLGENVVNQNPYIPVLGDYVYGLGVSGRASSSLGNHQALMVEASSCPDDSIFLDEVVKRMGISQDDGTCGLGLRREGSWSISCIAKTQLGCRLLQRMLNGRKHQDVQMIFNEVIHYVPELSLDPYANYLVQKLLDVCNEEQITQVVRVITRNPGERIRICKNSHGTRVVQKIIQKVKTRQQIALVLKALEAGFLDLITDVNGNHVLQQCLHCFTEEHNKFIFEGAATFCAKIATHRYGCCVLNQCILHSSKRYREKLITEICANGLLLAQDSFGNYVIQHILELKIPSAAVALLSTLKGHFVLLSMQKCGSHVVEKCLKCCEQSRPIIIHELLSVSRFGQLLQHPFANYVIQSALQVTKGPARTLLVKALQPYKTLNTNPYCKKIFSTNLLKK